MNMQDPKYQQKSKSISSPEQNYFLLYAMRYLVFVIPLQPQGLIVFSRPTTLTLIFRGRNTEYSYCIPYVMLRSLPSGNVQLLRRQEEVGRWSKNAYFCPRSGLKMSKQRCLGDQNGKNSVHVVMACPLLMINELGRRRSFPVVVFVQ